MGFGLSTTVSFNRTSDTNAYTGNDVLGPATGSTAAINFSGLGGVGEDVLLTSTTLLIALSSVTSGMTSFTLHLYNGLPASALGDNAAFDLPSGDRVNYLGAIALGTPVDLGASLFVEANNIQKHIKLTDNLYGYLVTAGGYTPASGTTYTVGLHGAII